MLYKYHFKILIYIISSVCIFYKILCRTSYTFTHAHTFLFLFSKNAFCYFVFFAVKFLCSSHNVYLNQYQQCQIILQLLMQSLHLQTVFASYYDQTFLNHHQLGMNRNPSVVLLCLQKHRIIHHYLLFNVF